MDGINEKDRSHVIQIFPNPTTGLLRITTDQPIKLVEITTIMGCIIKKSTEKNDITEIDLSDQWPGIYFIRLSDTKGNFVVKKIVRK